MKKVFLILTFLLFLIGCNPFPKEDSHPEVPYLKDLVKNKNILQKIDFDTIFKEYSFLKSSKILLQPHRYSDEFRIIDINKNSIFEMKIDSEIPTYFDKSGNIYCNNMKYFYPDYKKSIVCKSIDIKKIINDYQMAIEKTLPNNDSVFWVKSREYAKKIIKKNNLKVVDSLDNYGDHSYESYPKIVQDSIIKFNRMLYKKYPKQDSVLFKKVDDYEKLLGKKYKIDDLDRTKTGNYVQEQNGELIFWRDERFVNDFRKESVTFDNFDDPILFEWNNGKLLTPTYLYYFEIKKGVRVKDFTQWVCKQVIDKKTYLYSTEFGLYLVK